MTGFIGAKVQTWRAANPRELLKRMIDSDPSLDRVATLYLFRDKLHQETDADALIDTIIEYWFTNNYYSLVGPISTPRYTPDRQNNAATQIVQRVRQKIAEVAQIQLLEMLMPNGKRLAECSGRECREMGPVIGNWLARVARSMKAKDLVGNVMTEERLQDLYRGG